VGMKLDVEGGSGFGCATRVAKISFQFQLNLEVESGQNFICCCCCKDFDKGVKFVILIYGYKFC